MTTETKPASAPTRKHWQWWTSNSWRRLTSHDSIGRYEREGDVLCPCVATDVHPDLIVSEANMALIAAAPDLLAALEDLLTEPCIAPGNACGCETCNRLRLRRERAFAAIAKAKGGAS